MYKFTEYEEVLAFEAYWQACKDLNPMIDERTARRYFDMWWSKRIIQDTQEHPWWLE